MSNITLKRGDCLEVMRGIPDGSVDMVLCDLPYEATHNKWDRALPFTELWAEYYRVGKQNCPFVLFAQGLFYVDLVSSNKTDFRYDLVWDKVLKTGFLNANVMPLRHHEQIAVFYRSKPVYNPQKQKGSPNHTKGKAVFVKGVTNNNYGSYEPVESDVTGDMKNPGSILVCQKPHPSKAVHPTEKPVSLLEYLIRTYTNEGDTVLDNTMGSGSTGVACVNTGRDFIGIELDEKYFGIAEDRIRQAERDRKAAESQYSLF